ncbi:MAG: HAD hydrolase-like protein [Ruminococcus sp.]
MSCVYDYLLFDLDGTVSESGPGIKRCIELSMERLGRKCPDLSDYSKYIGPPLINTFMGLCGLSQEEAEKAVEFYREIYVSEGEPRNRCYDGIKELLQKIKETGTKAAICSSKHQLQVENVCSAMGIADCFTALCGSDASQGRLEKEEVIPYAISALGGGTSKRVVMIGDTCYDAKGARLMGVDFIGVTYGYGTEETMRKEGAEIFAKSPRELERILFGE